MAESLTLPDTDKSLIRTLVEDVEFALQSCRDDDTETNRRSAIRTIFAATEGAHWMAKRQIVRLGPRFANMGIHEIACLSEEGYSLTGQGRVKTQPKFTPMHTAVKLMLLILKRVRPTYVLDFNHPAWEHLQSSAKVRNRITHPKNRKT